MAEVDASYQAKVGREQGGNRFYMKEDGEFKFYDDDWNGAQLKLFLLSRTAVRYITDSGTKLSGPASLSQYATYILVLSTGASKISCYLPSAVRGATMTFNGSGVAGDANLSVYPVTDSLVAQAGGDLSCINCSAVFFLTLVCATDGAWQVAEASASCAEQASS